MLVPRCVHQSRSAVTKDLHHEVELVVAMRAAPHIATEKALDLSTAMRSHDSPPPPPNPHPPPPPPPKKTPPPPPPPNKKTRRDLQIASRKKERPWEVGKSFGLSAPSPRCSRPQIASLQGTIWLRELHRRRRTGDLTSLIWNVPEINLQSFAAVWRSPPGIIMTGNARPASPMLNPAT